ncbi:glutathione transferase GstA [Anaeromyxobacter diazotrophicus]|uniref:Glutathione S-transferase n=1 Tax=Anaeromyxobacter diazotrophicus TaxID=2590199 RepID=A0A7I9VP03_9BACT|nr:glutathione transferase GstA [Anaeromyxobacter diazotrophicus]GEJ58151.1 glutathione S-transferase [Anaeromyxobacter diazotrophicus]
MKLYYMPGACSLSPHIVLRELGLPFELERVDTKSGKTERGADFRALNPKGYVPVLQLDDGRTLTEGPAIVQYLADLAPEARLAPPNGSFERAQLQAWLNYVTSELHKSVGSLFNPSMPAEWRQATQQAIGARFDYLSSRLAGGGFLTGPRFTVADAYLFVVLSWTSHVGLDLARWPALKAFVDRVAARPAVQAALRAEGLA